MRFPMLPHRAAPSRALACLAVLLVTLAVLLALAPILDPDAGPVDSELSVVASAGGMNAGAPSAAGRSDSGGVTVEQRRRLPPAPGIGAAPRARAARPPMSAAARRERSLFNRLLAPGRFAYHEIARTAAARYRVEHRLVMAIIASESGGDPAAVSPAGAIGLMQLMPQTAERLGVDPWDPEQNVDGAVRYLASQLSTFKSVDLSLVAYNAGPGFAEKYRRGHVELRAETRAFLTRVGQLLQ